MKSALSIITDRLSAISAKLVTLQSARVTNVSPLRVHAGGESEVSASRLGWWAPAMNQPVWCLTMVGKVVALGGVDQAVLSLTGTVTATGTGTATVSLDQGGTFSLPVDPAYVPVGGHKVWINWSPFEWGKGIVGGQTPSSPGAQQPPPATDDGGTDSPTQATTITVTIPATEVRTWRNGGWRSDTTKAYQGDWSGSGANTGVWFYGSGWSQLSGWTITKVRRYDHRLAGGAGGNEQMRMRRHTGKSAGSSLPAITADALTGVSLVPGERSVDPNDPNNPDKWTDYPGLISWVQEFANAGQGGIAAVDATKGNYAAWSGLSGDGRDPMSGALRVTATRS